MDFFSKLPRPIKIGLATFSAGSLVGTAYLIDPRAIWFLLVGILAVLLVFGGYLIALKMMKRRRSEAMGGSLRKHGALVPGGVSDPARRARLDDLQANFQKGLSRYRAAGKDLYSVPWYLVVGEPGAGKTEALRNCNVGFPSGLQDKVQGAGGTINMHWWFTNQAVMIDTAGRLIFEEVPPGSTSEWAEFLDLLRRSRPNCPINGLILAIPSDSLIKDSPDEIASKAGRIAEQLNTIRSRMDVRFPVFILITKCDLICGFREFFSSLDDPSLQHQILGWSNADSLDQPFRPEIIDQHFEEVADDIRRRRLGLLQDPTPHESSDGRRLDEVDALFSLPASMAQVTPRLRRYLEAIFGENEWSGQPLFLRGIYFASAMREGSALDLDLAEAIGVPVDSLPDGKAWDRERAFFLRDVFTEKIFKERGLVTRASNTTRMLWRRQAILLGCGIAGMALLLATSWLGARSLRKSIVHEGEFWQAAKAGSIDGKWHSIVTPDPNGAASYVFNGAQLLKVGAREMELGEFHRQLAELVQSDLQVPMIFRPLTTVGSNVNEQRRHAQQIVYERGVVLPLVEAMRQTMTQTSEPWSAVAGEALAFLIRIEGMIQNQSREGSTQPTASDFFGPLGTFVYGADEPDPNLCRAYESVYLRRKESSKFWWPNSLSGGSSLDANHPIKMGVQRFVRELQSRQLVQSAGLDSIRKLRDELRGLKRAEEELARLTSVPEADFSRDVEMALGTALRHKKAFDNLFTGAMFARLDPTTNRRLVGASKTLTEETRSQSDQAFRAIAAELERFPTATDMIDDGSPICTLAGDIRKVLLNVQRETKMKTEGQFTADELLEMKHLDEIFLDQAAGDPLYIIRCRTYLQLAAQLVEITAGTEAEVGSIATKLSAARDDAKAAMETAKLYSGPFQREFAQVVKRTAEFAESARNVALFTRCVERIETSLERDVGFPLVKERGNQSMTFAAVRDTLELLRMARADLAAMRSVAPPATLRPRIRTLEARVERMAMVADALLAEDQRPTSVVITLLKREDQIPKLSMYVGNEKARNSFGGDYWTLLRISGNSETSSAMRNVDLGRFSVSDTSLHIELFRYPDDVDRNRVDRSVVMESGWPLLALLHEPYSRRLPGGKEWEVVLSLPDSSGVTRHLVLLLQFEKALPEPEQWPTAPLLGGIQVGAVSK